MNDRERFEAQMTGLGYSVDRYKSGEFIGLGLAAFWEVWQAARAAIVLPIIYTIDGHEYYSADEVKQAIGAER